MVLNPQIQNAINGHVNLCGLTCSNLRLEVLRGVGGRAYSTVRRYRQIPGDQSAFV